MIQGFGIAVGLENMRGAAGEMIVLVPGWSFRIMTVITLTAGTAFIMWLGEQITERGIGNGISLIIFAGIVARMPNAMASTFELFRVGQMSIITDPFLDPRSWFWWWPSSSFLRPANGGFLSNTPSGLSGEGSTGGRAPIFPSS